MFGNKDKNNDFHLLVNELFCLEYIEKFMKFDSIMTNKYQNEVKVIDITYISCQIKLILVKLQINLMNFIMI